MPSERGLGSQWARATTPPLGPEGYPLPHELCLEEGSPPALPSVPVAPSRLFLLAFFFLVHPLCPWSQELGSCCPGLHSFSLFQQLPSMLEVCLAPPAE